jgi:aminoglycoside phosphotransferase (APT) family kinase protein
MPQLLEAFLERQDPTLTGAVVTDFTPITGGYSRLMARFRVEHNGASRSLIFRGDPPPGQSMFDSDREYEWQLLSALTRAGTVPMPSARYYDPDGSSLGTRAIILDCVDGPSLVVQLAGAGDADQRAAAEKFCTVAAAIHQSDTSVLPESVARPGSWDDYISSQIAMWADGERQLEVSEPFMRYVGAWLDTHRPPPAPLGLVHGDFQVGNILVPPDGAYQVVDWEFAHIGDPREDLGWSKLVAATVPPDLIALDEAGFCARYRQLSGLSEDVVNPATIAYFTVLASVKVFLGLMGPAAAFARGEKGSVAVAYSVNAQVFLHQVWMNATQAIEGAAS